MSMIMSAVRGRRKKRSSSKDDTACGDRGPSSNPRSCTPPPGQDYEVFLSFRGVDTREGFTDHLYNRLNDAGVWVFRDNEGLHVGEKIGPKLIKAIKASKISIPIISQNYASSEWCLRELVQILECKKTGQIVLPIFYKVTPSDIRNQTGEFGQAFQLLQQEKYGSNDIQVWRKTLEEIASMKGLELRKIANGHEGVLVKVVLKKVLKKLKKTNLVVDDYLIGVQDHIERIIKMVDSKATTEVHVILIHGMGGIGKTTLAKLIYNQYSTQYDNRSFLSNVRERSLDDRGMVELQKQLISDVLGHTSAEDIACIDAGINIIEKGFRNKKALVLLDDVSHTNQLNTLARESGWFEPGSLLIITSRNKDILKKWDKKLTYGLNQLDLEQSFQLFCFHVFGREGARQSELEHIARKIVSTTGGLPLAIKVIGSRLFAEDKEVWEDTLQRLMETPNDEVMKILQISYDSLNHEEKQIFLDIACFSFHIEKKFAYYVWDACKFYPHLHVKNLISLSLIEIGDEDKLIMHDQLRDLGKTIASEESSNGFKKHSRLWNQEDVWEVLSEIQGTKEVEALSLTCDEMFEYDCLTSEHFKDLTKLRLLFLERASLNGDFDNLLTNLKWLQWKGGYPMRMETMPINFHPKKLVVLDLYRIPITEHWSGWSQPEVVKKLKVVRLIECYELRRTPDFSAFKELEILILVKCLKLEEFHLSIGSARKTLKTLSISSCDKLKELPKQVGEMERMKELTVKSIPIREIPISNGLMTELKVLLVESCAEHMNLPDSIGMLEALSKLVLSDLSITEVPESIGNLHNLEELGIDFCPSLKTIGDLSHLKKLRMLCLFSCEMLSGVEGMGQLTSLEELSLEVLPCIKIIGDLSHLKKLRMLKLSDCEMLGGVEGIGQLTSLEMLFLQGLPYIKTIGDLSHLKKLRELHLHNCEMLSGVDGIGRLTSLENLIFHALPCIKIIGDLSHLKKLSMISWSDCEMLSGVEGIGQLTSLEMLSLEGLPCIKTIGDLSHLKKLRELPLYNCEMLSYAKGIGQLTSLEMLCLDQLPCIKTTGDLSHLKKLRELHLYNCEMLSGVEGIGQLTSLEKLILHLLPCIKIIGDLSHLKKLRMLCLSDCEMLSVVEGISQLTSLETLYLDRLPCIKTIGDLSHLKKLRELSGVKSIGQLTSLTKLCKRHCPRLEGIPDVFP